MYTSSSTQDPVEHALRTLSHQATLNETQIDAELIDVSLTEHSIVSSVPLYADEIPTGHAGLTRKNGSYGKHHVSRTFTESLTRELYDAVLDRVKWFTRAHITPSGNDHILFFSDTLCRYNTRSETLRIPGVIRGPDAIQGHLPDGVDALIDTEAYLVPVHLLPDQYWERSQKCADCRVPFSLAPDKPWIPRLSDDREIESYKCPKCNGDTTGLSGRVGGTWFLHDNTDTPRHKRDCGPLPSQERYAYMDWLLDVEPGATTTPPRDFPERPTTISDGTVIDWLSPLEPVTNLTPDSLPANRPFVTIHPPETEHPFVVHQSDALHLAKAVKQQP